MTIGRWSEENFFSVVQKVSMASDGEQKVMSGDVLVFARSVWCGMCVCWVRSFSMCKCWSSCSMWVPLVLFGLFSYQAVVLPLKSPPMMRFCVRDIGCRGGM